MTALKTALLLAALSGLAVAQIPSLGWCPDYVPMADFNMERYLGTWYEAERYFTVLEAGSRCVSTNYTKAVDGRVLVSNQITNRLTGIKRVVEGEIRNVVKGAESKLNVKYSTLPVPFETQYSVLDTDYDSYSVVWSCSSIGPLRTQNAWVMTRERLAPGTVLQMAYGILDKYKISRTFFVKTDQADCAIAEAAAEAAAKAAEAAAIGVKSAGLLSEAAPAPAAAPLVAAAPAAIPAALPAALPAVAAEPLVAAPAAAPAPIIPEAAIPIVNVAQVVLPAEKSADAVVPAVAAAPAAPFVPAVPFVPIPIAMAEQIAAAPAAAPVVPVVTPIVEAPIVPAALPVAAADPIPAPAAPLIPAAPVIPMKEIIAEPIKTAIEPAKAIIEAPKA